MSARPQVGIERLPARRNSQNEPREMMNCKSCRKRKIKCNRLRPTCEACQVFQCSCIYDAVPKKRGPKTDVLEALLKRVDGLEKRLKDEKKPPSPKRGASSGEERSQDDEPRPKRLHIETDNGESEAAVYSPVSLSEPRSPEIQPHVLVDTYFLRSHGKPYHILEESRTRKRIQTNQIPSPLLFAIYAIGARYVAHPNGYDESIRLSEDYALRGRSELDVDEPSIDCLQTLLLLVIAFTAAGKGKKAYMLLSAASGMAMALELHRELDVKARVTPVERETRRRLFWTCYLLDRIAACGSKRPSLLADKCIFLRLPSWSPTPGALSIEGEFFQNGSNLQCHAASGKKSQGSSGMLIDIVRILGITNRYLTAGGVKGDSHFPWHSLSNLSKIRNDLDVWASGTQDVFASVDTLFGQPDSTSMVLSKLTYHLIHCLIYRPFLPIDLAELAGTGQHQSWQIEATNLCFLHANAIAELVELGKQSPTIEWPAFVGYCICTAGTVHVHGAHYNHTHNDSVFSTSADFLSREMAQLSELRFIWSLVSHQRDTLQTIYTCHSDLVKSLGSNPLRYSPVFHLEDFFDRYSDLGQFFDGAHFSFSDILPLQEELVAGSGALYQLQPRGSNASLNESVIPNSSATTSAVNGMGKRKQSSAARSRKNQTQHQHHLDLKIAHSQRSHHNHQTNRHRESQLMTPNGGLTFPDYEFQHQQELGLNSATTATFSHSPTSASHQIPSMPYSPPYHHFSQDQDGNYDPMFGMMGYTDANGTGGAGDGLTPGRDSVGTDGEKDPFLTLLEQLAENETSGVGGPSELDFFLGGVGGA